jgi:hypothetical protein
MAAMGRVAGSSSQTSNVGLRGHNPGHISSHGSHSYEKFAEAMACEAFVFLTCRTPSIRMFWSAALHLS